MQIYLQIHRKKLLPGERHPARTHRHALTPGGRGGGRTTCACTPGGGHPSCTAASPSPPPNMHPHPPHAPQQAGMGQPPPLHAQPQLGGEGMGGRWGGGPHTTPPPPPPPLGTGGAPAPRLHGDGCRLRHRLQRRAPARGAARSPRLGGVMRVMVMGGHLFWPVPHWAPPIPPVPGYRCSHAPNPHPCPGVPRATDAHRSDTPPPPLPPQIPPHRAR